MRCCSSVESRYSHSSSPNRRPETWPSQILSAKSFIFQKGAVTPHTHTHTFAAVWRGCWKPSKNSTNTSPATFLEDSAAWWSHSAELLFMCLCVCVFVYMWTLCCVLRFDITEWKNHPHLKVIIPFWEQFSAGWVLREWDCRELAECRRVAGSTASDARVEAECLNGALLLGGSKKPELPCPKKRHTFMPDC